jgi:hypothetical protein
MHFPMDLVSLTRLTLKRISDWSAIKNECICHLFDVNLGELGAFLQTWEIQATKSVIFKIIHARKG